MTIAVLLRNTLVAAHARAGLPRAGGAVTELFVSAFVTFLVVIDPPGCAPIFAGLTQRRRRRRTAAPWRSARSLIAAGILLFFALLGEDLLRALGISLSAFRIAGGIMLFLIAIDMVFEKRTERRENRAEEVSAREAEDISVFPMAIPMIAGPGSIASVMLLMARSEGLAQSLVVLGALLATLVLTLLALLAAGPLMRLLGHRMEAMITRLLGVILAALAAQFVIDGIERSFLADHPPHPVGRVARQRHRLQPVRHLAAHATGRRSPAAPPTGRWSIPTCSGRSAHSRPGSARTVARALSASPRQARITSMICARVAVIGAGDRVVRRHRDQPRAQIDEGQHRAGRLLRRPAASAPRVGQRLLATFTARR